MSWTQTGISIDVSQPQGNIRAIHGANNGPWFAEMFVDNSHYFREAGFPDLRLHDPQYPARNVVDINAVFPDLSRDPSDPNSYDFLRTDEYLKKCVETGATVMYRLGYTIDHHSARRFAQPPKDIAKFGQICAGIVKHYALGWAGGLPKMVHRWEIWNEPDQRPWQNSPCFQGPWELFHRTYESAAKAIKALDPALDVGGCGMTQLGTEDGFLIALLRHCQATNTPLDFLSWHIYTDHYSEVIKLAAKVRQQLDENGFPNAKMPLTEWHYLPWGEPWDVINNTPGNGMSYGQHRLNWEMNGPKAASFTAATLIALQESPVEMTHYYEAEPLMYFGLFDSLNKPQPPFNAILLFNRLIKGTPNRVKVTFENDGHEVLALAGVSDDGRKLRVLVVNDFHGYRRPVLKIAGGGKWTWNPTAQAVVDSHAQPVPWPLKTGDRATLPGWSVMLAEAVRED